MNMITLAAKNPSTDEARAAVRKPMIASFKASDIPISKYLRRLAEQEAMLLALKAKVSARLGTCPAVPEKGHLGFVLDTTEENGEISIRRIDTLVACKT